MSDLRVAMIFGSGGLGAGGYYNEMGLKGLRQAEAELGVGFDHRAAEGNADFEPPLRELAGSGRYALICVMSFGASTGLSRVADEFPAQMFAAFDARAEKPNVANYASEPESVSFLAGAAAGWMSRTGTVGTLFGTEGPGYWRWVASYIAGAKFAVPELEVAYEFLPEFSPSPEQGEQAATRLYDAGADVIMAHLDQGDRGIFAAARRLGRYALGFNGERHLDPEHIVFDVTRHLEVSVYDAIRRLVQGTLRPGLRASGLKEGQYALDFGSPGHPLVGPSLLERIEILTRELNAETHGPLPVRHEDVQPFLQALGRSG